MEIFIDFAGATLGRGTPPTGFPDPHTALAAKPVSSGSVSRSASAVHTASQLVHPAERLLDLPGGGVLVPVFGARSAVNATGA